MTDISPGNRCAKWEVPFAALRLERPADLFTRLGNQLPQREIGFRSDLASDTRRSIEGGPGPSGQQRGVLQ